MTASSAIGMIALMNYYSWLMFWLQPPRLALLLFDNDGSFVESLKPLSKTTT
jgi:hypothetical protein